MEWMILPFKRYADFTGRSSRMDYWMFQLLFFGVLLVAVVVFAALDSRGITSDGPNLLEAAGGIAAGLFVLASVIPMLAVTVRRLHDQDKSGWYYLLNFIPYVGGFILLFFMCTRGTDGENQYGPDPLNPHIDTSVFS